MDAAQHPPMEGRSSLVRVASIPFLLQPPPPDSAPPTFPNEFPFASAAMELSRHLALALASVNTLTLDTHRFDFSITYVAMLRVGKDTVPLTSRCSALGFVCKLEVKYLKDLICVVSFLKLPDG